MFIRLLSVFATLFLSLGVMADNWPYANFTTGPWHPPELHINKTNAADPGFIFIGPRGNSYAGVAALIYDNDGNLVYQGPEGITSNFRTQKLWGEDVISYWAGDITAMGFGFGTVYILDSTYREIYTVKLQGDFLTPDGRPRDSYIDLHESLITPRNTLLISAYNTTGYDLSEVGGEPGQYILDSQFYEVDIPTNKILYSWSALDHEKDIPLSKSYMALGEAGTQSMPWDAYHLNAIEPTEHGYLVSLRHYWSAYYLNHDGSIRWQLNGHDGADFQLDNVGFSWQHDLRVFNESDDSLTLSLFNNANSPGEVGTESTGISLRIDLASRKASLLCNISDADDPIHSISQGNFQRMSSNSAHTFLGYGSISKVKEFDANGNKVLSAQFGELGAVLSYRSFKSQWKATPFWNPAVAANRTSDGADVYMSWNGATEYDSWAIYSVPSAKSGDARFISSHTRTGFETKASISGLPPTFIQAVARRGDRIMGNSGIIPL